MHLPNRNTIRLCIHLLQTKHDHLVKSEVKVKDAKDNEIEGPIINIKQALDDLIRYDSYIALLQSSIQDL